MKTNHTISYMWHHCALFSRVPVAIIAVFTAVFSTGCASKPEIVTMIEPPPPVPLLFSTIGTEPLADRSSVAAQSAISEANRIWVERSTEKAGYLRAARLLNAALDAGHDVSAEEQVRLATMALQNALLADDAETLSKATQHWERGFAGIGSAPNGGEVETFLLACRRLGQDLPTKLVDIAHPEIQAVFASHE